MPRELEGIFERLGTHAETYRGRMEKFQKQSFMGRFLAARASSAGRTWPLRWG